MQDHRLIVEIFSLEGLTNGELPLQDGFREPASLRGPTRSNTERRRGQDGERLPLEVLLGEFEHPPEVRTILLLASFVLRNLVLLLEADQTAWMRAWIDGSCTCRCERQTHSVFPSFRVRY